MDYCKKFVKSPKTIKLLKKKWTPLGKKLIKKIRTKTMTKKMEDSLLKVSTNAFVKGFADEFCNKICPDTIACGSGKHYEKLWLKSINDVDFQKILGDKLGIK